MRNIIFPAFIEFRARGGRLIYGTVIEIGFKPSPKMAVSMRECEQPPPLLLHLLTFLNEQSMPDLNRAVHVVTGRNEAENTHRNYSFQIN